MHKTTRKRQQQFRAALALAGMTAVEFAKGQDVTPSHLYQVLRGSRESVKLLTAVDEFTHEQLSRAAANLAA